MKIRMTTSVKEMNNVEAYISSKLKATVDTLTLLKPETQGYTDVINAGLRFSEMLNNSGICRESLTGEILHHEAVYAQMMVRSLWDHVAAGLHFDADSAAVVHGQNVSLPLIEGTIDASTLTFEGLTEVFGWTSRLTDNRDFGLALLTRINGAYGHELKRNHSHYLLPGLSLYWALVALRGENYERVVLDAQDKLVTRISLWLQSTSYRLPDPVVGIKLDIFAEALLDLIVYGETISTVELLRGASPQGDAVYADFVAQMDRERAEQAQKSKERRVKETLAAMTTEERHAYIARVLADLD